LYASSLWTLQHLCFGPDVAADYSDRGENRDPGRRQEKSLTKETRLENAPVRKSFYESENILSDIEIGAVRQQWALVRHPDEVARLAILERDERATRDRRRRPANFSEGGAATLRSSPAISRA
jgi:hypothetical protein